MFFTIDKFGGNLNLTIFVNLLIYIIVLLGVPSVFLGFLSLFKFKASPKRSIYLYAFSTGMFLIIGAAGFIKEGYFRLEYFFHDTSTTGGYQYTSGNQTKEQLFIALIVGSASLIGLAIVILGRYLFVKLSKTELHVEHDHHSHSDHLFSYRDVDNPKAAWTAILMILSHRIIDGLVLGVSVFQLTSQGYQKPNLALIITFNIHLLFEVVIVYYRQIQYGESKLKAIGYNLLTLVLIIPIMFLGAFLGQYINKVAWIEPFLTTMGGAIIVFMSVIELVPEFIHYRNESTKTIYITLIVLASSIVLTLIFLSFHTHTQSSPNITGGFIEGFRNRELVWRRN
ncbi:Uncharacterised protein [Metamycoplasma cloacale]|uniref:Uncharacterized protein n=1 Tax=Metamycoplasma cloacale TaxID=92401 RepID=A0A2Z4LLL5_9BACT|nr:hypothetical protein [Metamycoplasma cloacale]AWX42595.1 hypothetical protein DK849_00650 [Metamycoplasma cloacale]VEU79674.1 Uncharacterised protein [Metamycoplasma cloacale]